MFTNMLKSIIGYIGGNPHRRVSDRDVEALLAKLHPFRTAFELVRLGKDGDGGYLLPDDLAGIAACFSPGVDLEASFEAALLERGIPCFLADASVEGPPMEHDSLDFVPKFLGVVEDDRTMTLDRWVAEKAPEPLAGDLILQIDIEGHEWPVLLAASEDTLRRFRIIVVELHDLPNCIDPLSYRLVDGVLSKLAKTFHVVHAHPNPVRDPLVLSGMEIPYLLEVTLLRKDRSEALEPAGEFPHPLDRSNLPGRADMVLPTALRRARQP